MSTRIVALCPADTGRRVTVRALRLDSSSADVDAFDTVGRLLSVAPGRVEVEHRSGTLVTLGYPPHADPELPPVVASRVVPPDISAIALQAIAQRGWPAREHQLIDDWEMRWSGGVGGRADSVRVGGDPASDLTARLAIVSDWYRTRGGVPRLQIPQPWLVEKLSEAGWEEETRVLMMTARTRDLVMDAPPSAQVRLESQSQLPDPWMRELTGSDRTTQPELAALLDRPAAVTFVSALDPVSGEVLGTGRASAADGWCGITSISTAPQSQRRGIARSVSAALLTWARDRGVDHCYVQVLVNNVAARELYGSLGFHSHHEYAYWCPADEL